MRQKIQIKPTTKIWKHDKPSKGKHGMLKSVRAWKCATTWGLSGLEAPNHFVYVGHSTILLFNNRKCSWNALPKPVRQCPICLAIVRTNHLNIIQHFCWPMEKFKKCQVIRRKCAGNGPSNSPVATPCHLQTEPCKHPKHFSLCVSVFHGHAALQSIFFIAVLGLLAIFSAPS